MASDDDEEPATTSYGWLSSLAIILFLVGLFYYVSASNGLNPLNPGGGDGFTDDAECAKNDAKKRKRGGKQEENCRDILERWFGVSFPSTRLTLLANDLPGQATGRSCELDGYNRSVHVGFEFQGIQHFELRFGMTPQELLNYQARDAMKIQRAAENGFTLLVATYLDVHDLEGVLAAQLPPELQMYVQ